MCNSLRSDFSSKPWDPILTKFNLISAIKSFFFLLLILAYLLESDKSFFEEFIFSIDSWRWDGRLAE